MSIVSGTVGAVMGANSQDNATRANRKNAKETNAANLLMNLMMRGGAISAADAKKYNLPDSVVGKSSAILPYYLNETETQAGEDASGLYAAAKAFLGSPDEQLAFANGALSKYQAAFDANDQLVIDIGSGKVTQDMIDESQPVFGARMDVANARKNAGLEALKATLNEIDAIQARKGFTGDSFGNRMLRFNARRGIATQGATDVGNATLENAMEQRSIQQQGRGMRISSIGLPDTLARSSIDRNSLPVASVARNADAAFAPLNRFNIGPGSPSQNQRFTEDPSTSPWQLLAQGAGAAGNMAGNYFLQKRLQDNAISSANSAAVNSFVSNPNNWSTGSYAPAAGTAGAGAASIAPAAIEAVPVA